MSKSRFASPSEAQVIPMLQRAMRRGFAFGLLAALALGGCTPTTQTSPALPIATVTPGRAVTPAPAVTPTASASGTEGAAVVTSSGREIVFAIQPGTAQRQAAGEVVAMFPPEVKMTLGSKDILVIRNDDSVPVSIDGLLLDPGQKATQKYFTTGIFTLVCSTDYHNERVKIVVEGPGK